MNYVLKPRSWWDNSSLPRLGDPVARLERTEIFVHHTVGVDPDPTPNTWETEAEIIAYMRRLQIARAQDLGADVPYNFVAFITVATLFIVEGRGFDRSGAHTKYHNRTALATSFAGDFHTYPVPDQSAVIGALNSWFAYQQQRHPNIVTINGHRDAQFSGTACPGNWLYATKPQWAFEEDDMTIDEWKAAMRDPNLFPELGGKSVIDQLKKAPEYTLDSIGEALKLASDNLREHGQ